MKPYNNPRGRRSAKRTVIIYFEARREFQFRWNNRKSQDILMLVIAALVIGSSLRY